MVQLSRMNWIDYKILLKNQKIIYFNIIAYAEYLFIYFQIEFVKKSQIKTAYNLSICF